MEVWVGNLFLGELDGISHWRTVSHGRKMGGQVLELESDGQADSDVCIEGGSGTYRHTELVTGSTRTRHVDILCSWSERFFHYVRRASARKNFRKCTQRRVAALTGARARARNQPHVSGARHRDAKPDPCSTTCRTTMEIRRGGNHDRGKRNHRGKRNRRASAIGVGGKAIGGSAIGVYVAVGAVLDS